MADNEKDVQTERDAQPYATNLLTQRKKTQADIEAGKRRIDANEK